MTTYVHPVQRTKGKQRNPHRAQILRVLTALNSNPKRERGDFAEVARYFGVSNGYVNQLLQAIRANEHRGLDHKGVERDCIQEVHFCWPVGRDDEGDAPELKPTCTATVAIGAKRYPCMRPLGLMSDRCPAPHKLHHWRRAVRGAVVRIDWEGE